MVSVGIVIINAGTVITNTQPIIKTECPSTYVIILSVFQAISYCKETNIACIADECSNVGIFTECSIVSSTDGTVEQTVIDGLLSVMSVADKAADIQVETMNTARYPTTLDIGVIAVPH